jgi:hypothetical protein
MMKTGQTGTAFAEYTAEKDVSLRIFVLDSTVGDRLARVDLMGTGLQRYVNLADLFNEDGQPELMSLRAPSVAEVAPTTSEVAEQVIEKAKDEPESPIKHADEDESAKLTPSAALSRMISVLKEYEGFDIQVLFNITHSDGKPVFDTTMVRLAVSASSDASQQMVDASGGSLNLVDIADMLT